MAMARVILEKDMANRGSWYVAQDAAFKEVAVARLKCARGTRYVS